MQRKFIRPTRSDEESLLDSDDAFASQYIAAPTGRQSTITIITHSLCAIIGFWLAKIQFSSHVPTSSSIMIADTHLPIAKITSCSHLPLGEITPCSKFSEVRDLTKLRSPRLQSINFPGQPEQSVMFLDGRKSELKQHSLYAFENYARVNSLESAVTNLFISILSTSDPANGLVIDGGMNSAFYTMLTTSMNFTTYAFDLQLDCFDVANFLLAELDEPVKSLAHLYNFGLSDKFAVLRASKNSVCDPSFSISKLELINNNIPPDLTYDVSLMSIDGFLANQNIIEDDIILVKLDIEGAEVPALHGMQSAISAGRVKNIILEFSPSISLRMGVDWDTAKSTFEMLQRTFTPYLLFNWKLERNEAVYLAQHGLLTTRRVDAEYNDDVNFQDLFEIVDWELMVVHVCGIGCNIYFKQREEKKMTLL